MLGSCLRATVAQMAKDVPKASREAIVFSLSFIIKDNVDGKDGEWIECNEGSSLPCPDFALGELSGSLRDVISTAGKNFQCTHKSTSSLRSLNLLDA